MDTETTRCAFFLLSLYFFLHLYLANEFNILLQCSYTFSSASFAPPPLFVVMMTTMIITRFCHKAKQCSFLVIFLCTAVVFFFSPSLACVKDASYPRVFTDNILHVCVQ